MSEPNAVVAVYNSHTEAEAAINELKRAAFNITKLSIVGKDYHTDEHVVGYYNAGDRMKYWGKLGALWGSIFGWFIGAGFFAIPGIGPVLVAGPLLGWVLGALEGAAITGGMTAIGAGLFSLGIPKDSVLNYETALKSNKFILVAHGTAEEAAQARKILQTTGPHSIETHTPADTTAGVGA
ncbi:MAG: general stress protein [Nitrospirota bacterium]